MWEKDKENVRGCVHTSTYRATSLFLGRKGFASGKSYLLADAGPSSPPRCEVLVQTSFVLNGKHPLGCIFMRKLKLLCKHHSLKVFSQPSTPQHCRHFAAASPAHSPSLPDRNESTTVHEDKKTDTTTITRITSEPTPEFLLTWNSIWFVPIQRLN